MALNAIRKATTCCDRLFITNLILHRRYSLYEPDYLEVGKSKIPLYPTLNITIKGYTFPILESYQRFIHKAIRIMGLDIDDCCALPPKELKIQRFKSKSEAVIAEYNLNIYERSIQLSDISATQCPLLIRVLEATLPEGVSLTVDMYDEEKEKKRRYIPDTTLMELTSELEALNQPTKSK